MNTTQFVLGFFMSVLVDYLLLRIVLKETLEKAMAKGHKE